MQPITPLLEHACFQASSGASDFAGQGLEAPLPQIGAHLQCIQQLFPVDFWRAWRGAPQSLMDFSTCTQQHQASIQWTHAPLQNSNVGGYNSKGFVEVLAASQSTVSKQWFQGTADAVRQYLWLFEDAERGGVEDLLILSGGLG